MVRLVHGFGVNDVDYKVSKSIELPKIDGKRNQKIIWICPYYQKWQNMLFRCGKSYKKANPSYNDCTVAPEWKYLSNFVKWVDEQPNKDWKNCHLDKDILIDGNKLYSPETCVFVTESLNKFILTREGARGKYLLGCYFAKHAKRFKAKCVNPFTGKTGDIGYFDTELEAHLAWKAKKHQYACALADLQDDPRIAEALKLRYQ